MKRLKSDDPLVGFLYILLRDHLPFGTVEGIVEDHVEPARGLVSKYTNGYAAKHAMDLAARLRK